MRYFHIRGHLQRGKTGKKVVEDFGAKNFGKKIGKKIFHSIFQKNLAKKIVSKNCVKKFWQKNWQKNFSLYISKIGKKNFLYRNK